MSAYKMPPKAKVYEALSAVADGRVRMKGPDEAEVVSSGGDRTYAVRWAADGRRISSNDNASYWQGYTGYPVIAVLLALGKIEFDAGLAKWLAGVAWKRLNDEVKRDYDRAVERVLQDVAARGGDRAAIEREADRIHAQLATLRLERERSVAPPPNSNKPQ